jgi:hypothetical protein
MDIVTLRGWVAGMVERLNSPHAFAARAAGPRNAYWQEIGRLEAFEEILTKIDETEAAMLDAEAAVYDQKAADREAWLDAGREHGL